ncbi:MAG: HD domain-containing protein [Clostridiales bacterium]|nr:HD domain-containing protein [Clostridiales bacterium]
MNKDSMLIDKTMKYFKGDPKRIQHFIKVYTFATLIGEEERLGEREMLVLRTAAIVHDTGIKIGEEKYGRSDGAIQEREGPSQAEMLMREVGYDDDIIESVKFLVAHHHSYGADPKKELRILAEADFIVNALEDNMSKESIMFGSYKVFRTAAGKRILKNMYNL